MQVVDIQLERIEGADFSGYSHIGLSFDATGCLLMTELRENLDPVSVFELKHGEVIETRLSVSARFPQVTRFGDGRWLVVSSRSFDSEKNANVLDPTGTQILAEFEVGDSVEYAVVDQNDKIWIGHFDENPMGVRTYKADGQSGAAYNLSTGLDLFDVYAMHAAPDGIWVCAYTEFQLNRLTSEGAETVLEAAPLQGCGTILVSGSYAVFVGDYDGQSVLYDLRSNITIPIRLLADGQRLSRPLCATRGDQLVTLVDENLYQINMAKILAAVGRV